MVPNHVVCALFVKFLQKVAGYIYWITSIVKSFLDYLLMKYSPSDTHQITIT